MGEYLEWPRFRGKYSKIRHTTCIFLNIFVQEWRLAQWWEHSLHTDVAWVWISEITPFLVWFYVLPRENISQFQFDGQFQTKNAYVVDALLRTKSVCLLVYLFNPYFLPSGPSFHPYVRSTFVPPSTYSLRGYSMLPWIVGAFHSPKICLKFWTFHVTVSGTVPNVWFAPNTTREPK